MAQECLGSGFDNLFYMFLINSCTLSQDKRGATTSVSHPFGRPGNLRVLDLKGNFSAVLRRNYVELY
jgi:hypothetical protein